MSDDLNQSVATPQKEAEPTVYSQEKIHPALRTFWFLFFFSIIVYGFYYQSSTKIIKERTTLSSIPFVSTLEVTGKVVPQDSATLSFERSGAIQNITVKEGDIVTEGSVLVVLSSKDLTSEKVKAEAQLAKARADLRSLLRGANKEDVAVKEALIASNDEVLSTRYKNSIDTLKTVNSTISKEIRAGLALLFVYQTGDIYRFSFNSCDQIEQNNLEGERSKLQKKLLTLDTTISGLSNLSTISQIDTALKLSSDTAVSAKEFIANTQDFLSNNCNSKDLSVAPYRAQVALSFNAVSDALSSLQSENDAIIAGKNTLNASRKELLALKAGANIDQRDSLLALVSQANANLDSLKIEENKTKVVAPFDAIISKLFIHKGENAQVGNPVVSLLSSNGYQVESYVREIDVTALHVGNGATITIDALPKGTIIKGVVSHIDPSPTMQGGVPLYRILVVLKDDDDRVRDGLSAKLSMILYKNDAAVSVPPRFIRLSGVNKGYVKFVNGDNVFEKKVTVGQRGDSGQIEIVDGLSPGDILEVLDDAPRGAQKAPINETRKTAQ